MNQSILSLVGDGDITKLPATRSEARALGVKRYYTGKPCPKGHVTYRYAAGGGCAECQAIRAKQKYEGGWRQDKSTRPEINARWNASTKGAVAKQKWREKDPKRAWAVYATGGAKSRARKAGIEFDLDHQYVLSITPDSCPVFGTAFKFIDNGHIVPESATIDRLKPELGYVRGNVAVISMKANNIKSRYNASDVAKVAQWMYEQGL